MTVAGSNSDELIVTSGLAGGERVALDWPVQLKEGVVVREAAP